MHSRTPLLLLVAALPFTGCTCEWHASTQKTWSTNSGGERVVVVQDPDADARERDWRARREREWERQRDRDRNSRPRTVSAGGRTGVGPAPHGSPGGQPSDPANGGAVGGGGAIGAGGAVAPTPTPTPATPENPVVAPPPPPPPPPPPAGDTYVAPREINKPTGGPSKAANQAPTSNDKNQPAAPARSGPMQRQ